MDDVDVVGGGRRSAPPPPPPSFTSNDDERPDDGSRTVFEAVVADDGPGSGDGSSLSSLVAIVVEGVVMSVSVCCGENILFL